MWEAPCTVEKRRRNTTKHKAGPARRAALPQGPPARAFPPPKFSMRGLLILGLTGAGFVL